MRRGDYMLFAVTGALFALCHFVLFVPDPLIAYHGDAGQQVELVKAEDVLDSNGYLALAGWARSPLPVYNPQNIKRMSNLPVLSSLHRFRMKAWEKYTLWNSDFSFSISFSDFNYIAQISISFVDFKTRKYISNGFTVPTAELQFPTDLKKVGKHVDLLNNQFGVKAVITVSSEGHRNVQFSSPTFSANFTLKPSPDQEYLTLVAPIGSSNFYYSSKLYNSVAEGNVKVEEDEPLSITPETHSRFEWNRGVFNYRSQWAQLGASTMLDGKRKLSLHFGTGLGNQSAASENAIIIDDKIYKLGHINIEYDENSLTNPWILTSEKMHIVFAPFVEFQTQSSKTFVLLSNRAQHVFGKFIGSIVLEGGEEVSLEEVTGCAEVNYASW